MENERWYSVADIAQMLEVHEQTVRDWLKAGELIGYRFSGKTGYRVRQGDLEQFLATRRTEGFVQRAKRSRLE
jgi:excisionase family DNA binding protein